MYLDLGRTYYRGSEQCASRGRFLILAQPDRPTIGETCCASNTYAFVRSVALRQCGHFMMGCARVNGKTISLSGAYGNGGAPCNIGSLPKDAVLLPRELYAAWSKGGSGFSLRVDYADDLCLASCVDLILVLESFNRYAGVWCKAVPEMWAEECELRKEVDDEEKLEGLVYA